MLSSPPSWLPNPFPSLIRDAKREFGAALWNAPDTSPTRVRKARRDIDVV